MRLRNIWVIAKREYLARVKTKSFWISTVLLPVFMLAMIVGPSYFMSRTQADQRLVLVDETGILGERAVERLERLREGARGILNVTAAIEPAGLDPEAKRRELNERVRNGEMDAWLWLGADLLEGGRPEYHAESVTNVLTQEILSDAIAAARRELLLERAGVGEEVIRIAMSGIRLETHQITATGSAEESGGLSAAAVPYGLGLLFYMVLLIYGMQVLNGVLEEKASRVVEVIVSAAQPFELMMGKLLGILGVALSQLSIWLGSVFAALAPWGLAAVVTLPAERLPTLPVAVVVHFIFHFLLGFFVFATLYAALGSAFNNVQEAQQVSTFVTLVVVAALMMMFGVINAPDSTFAQVASLIPLFTPLLMMVRIASKMPPWWQIALGYLLTASFGIAMVWLAARIYRVGILMYGKKPTPREIIRWIRY